ncbi:Cof-type HAD-IIB family hydrolase [Winslowiella iniecta]|uniref:Sugar phosphatase n=1 Tax=Winslowiella iniecta TaxID=1560201 RepID=A0A0L7TF88_9GAMM|nr:Cof-type HAD-IIB family hydrolase [Winslowiella iniecta]KOC90879.1 sugar phosphatase [Winslowiella iniecta]KOC94029.1 sugar phosphatase [Winslowiella iniecta]
MSVKLIAVDMDGTFLSDSKSYNRARFSAQYQEMQRQGIKFVVASGNQFYQLVSFFPEIAAQIAFVAENGAYVTSENQPLFCGHIPADDVRHILAELSQRDHLHTVVCGEQGAWLHHSAPEKVTTLMSRHYHRLQRYHDVAELPDDIFKFALTLDDALIPSLSAHLHSVLNGSVTPVTSGFGFVDLIIPGVHKANGLKILQRHWQIDDAEVLAFGDSANDREMLTMAGYSFSMANASEEIKRVARYQAGHNNEEAVLDVIERALEGGAPFN